LSIKNECHLAGQSPRKPLFDWSIFPYTRQRSPDKRFSRSPRHQRIPHLLQFGEASQKRIVFLEALAKSESWINSEMIAFDTGKSGRLRPLAQVSLHDQNRVADRGQRSPLRRTSSRVHENSRDFQFGQRLSHLRIPAEATDVIHNLRTCFYRRPSDTSLVGVNA